jgi:hypothetical protein
MSHDSRCYVWQHGVQFRGIDGCPGESYSRRASWWVLYLSRSGFKGSSVGASRLVAIRTPTWGLSWQKAGGCTAAGVAMSHHPELPQCRGWRCSAWDGAVAPGMVPQWWAWMHRAGGDKRNALPWSDVTVPSWASTGQAAVPFLTVPQSSFEGCDVVAVRE